MSRDVRRIVVFRAGGLADMLAIVPALRALRFGFPTAEITLIGFPWADRFAQQFAHYVDRFVPFSGMHDPAWIERFLHEQRAREFDLAIQLNGADPACNRLIADLGAWVCAGHYVERPPDGLHVAAPCTAGGDEAARCLALVKLLGCPDYGLDPEFPLLFEDRRQASALLRSCPADGPRIGIHPGSGEPASQWPPECFAEVADALWRRFGACSVLLGEADEAAGAVASLMESPTLDLTGKTTLGGLGAVVHALDLIIAGDAGIAALALATGTPCVTLGEERDETAPEPPTHAPGAVTSAPEDVLKCAEQLLCAPAASIRRPQQMPALAARPGPSGWAQVSDLQLS